MQFISGLNQDAKNMSILRSQQYFNNNNNSLSFKDLQPPPPPDVYSFERKLSIINLASNHTETLLLRPCFSCNLLTTLYLYASEYCLLALFLLLLCYTSLVLLCLLLSFHSYHNCFQKKSDQKGKIIKRHPFSPGQNVCPHQCSNSQRQIIIQVKEALKGKSQEEQPLQPPAPAPAPRSPPKTQAAQAANEENVKEGVKGTTAVVVLKNEPQQKEQPPSVLFKETVVLDGKDSESQHSQNSESSLEVLAMHLATHLTTVQSFFESRKERPFGRHAKKKSRSISNSSTSSLYLSDLPPPLSLSSGTAAAKDRVKKLKKKGVKKHSILCFPLSTNKGTFTLALDIEPPEEEEEEFQTADEDILLVKQKAEELIPLPSHQVPPYMLLNRFAHQLPERKLVKKESTEEDAEEKRATREGFEYTASSSESS